MLYLSMIRRGLPSFSSLVDPVVWHYIHSLAEDHAGRYKLKESMHSKSIQQHFRTYRTIHIRLVHTNLLFLHIRFHRQYNYHVTVRNWPGSNLCSYVYMVRPMDTLKDRDLLLLRIPILFRVAACMHEHRLLHRSEERRVEKECRSR